MVSTRRWDGFSPWRSGCIGKAAGPYNWRCFPWRPAMRSPFGSWRHPLCSWGLMVIPSHRWQRPYRLGGVPLALWPPSSCARRHDSGRFGPRSLVVSDGDCSRCRADAGAGPVPLCSSMPIIGSGSLLISLAAVAVHTLAMLAVTWLISLVVYHGSGSRSCGGAGLISICCGRVA